MAKTRISNTARSTMNITIHHVGNQSVGIPEDYAYIEMDVDPGFEAETRELLEECFGTIYNGEVRVIFENDPLPY